MGRQRLACISSLSKWMLLSKQKMSRASKEGLSLSFQQSLNLSQFNTMLFVCRRRVHSDLHWNRACQFCPGLRVPSLPQRKKAGVQSFEQRQSWSQRNRPRRHHTLQTLAFFFCSNQFERYLLLNSFCNWHYQEYPSHPPISEQQCQPPYPPALPVNKSILCAK